jgi:hypothetical protein
MSAPANAVTDDPGAWVRPLPLHHSHVVKSIPYFYCAKCGREKPFSWTYAFCTETGDLLCLAHELNWRLCRRCRQPRHNSQFAPGHTQYQCHNTICDECRVGDTPQREPLQMVCAHCRNPFTAKRSDARFCSGRCRTAAHRAVTAQKPDSSDISRHTEAGEVA